MMGVPAAVTVPKSRSRCPIAVTGIGLFCPIGRTPSEVLDSIKKGQCGIDEILSFDTGSLKIKHGAEIRGYDPLDYFTASEAKETDRTAQFAIIAAKQAFEDAAISFDQVEAERIGLVMGVCAGGQGYSNVLADVAPNDYVAWATQDRNHVLTFLSTAHFVQTDAVAYKLGINGPRATISTACASSGTALGYAYDLLQSGKADVVLAGGADAFSRNTYAGFYALGAMAPKPCSPFSEGLGVTFGEGAGFVVLEPLARARARGATIYGELLGYGFSGDAHHITSPHPSGEGLTQAINIALATAGLGPADVDYVNAHGTGTRDNDRSESVAIKEVFKGLPSVPPVSSSKSFFGHTLGAAAILEFIVSLLCQNADLIPPTLNFEFPRPGCDLDYVPNQARAGKIRCFLSNSAAFGGVNVVLVGGRPESGRSLPELRLDDIAITGMGIISPIGCSVDSFVDGLRHGSCGIGEIDRFDTAGCRTKRAGLVKEFEPRRLVPTVDLRRMDKLNQYATVAAGLALKDASLDRSALSEDRIGVVVALTRGPVSTQERFFDSLTKDGIEKLSAKYFPSMVVSTVGGQISQAFRLKGLNSTVVEGTTAGLHALIHGFELLRQNHNQDAVVVVAADEIGSLFFRLFDYLGVLATENGNGKKGTPYDPNAAGMVLGEGAVAIVLERLGSARSRQGKVYAQLSGYGLTSDAHVYMGLEPDGKWLERAMELALEEARLDVANVDMIYGHGRGVPAYDGREQKTFARLLKGRETPVGCVMGNTGVAEAASGLFSVAAAVMSMQRGEAYPIVSAGRLKGDVALIQGNVRPGSYRRVLVAGSTEHGNNAAVLLRRFEEPGVSR